MEKYYVYIEYQYVSKNGKPGRKLYSKRWYNNKNLIDKNMKKFKELKNEEFKLYGGKIKDFKYKIKKIVV